jgi:Zn-dependent M28 family amino/carboxypeptidase
VKNIIGLSKNKLINQANKGRIKDVPPAIINIHFENVEKTIETANVIGIIRGESDLSIVVSAHYDHMGREDNLYYPGADDNASGVAALLELAEEFAQYKNLKYTMMFLATSAEEGGLLGSLYHTGRADFESDKIVCNLNIDMISRCDDNHTDCHYLYCIGNDHSDMLDSLVMKADELFTPCEFDYTENNSGIFGRSDGYNFQKKGIPSILFFSGFHDDYHQPTDTIDKINFDILESRIRLIGEVIKLIQHIG